MHALATAHFLSLLPDLPQPDFTVKSTGDQLFAVTASVQTSHSLRNELLCLLLDRSSTYLGDGMHVLNQVNEFAGLWREGSNFAVRPARKDALAIAHKLKAIARTVLVCFVCQLNLEQLSLVANVKNPDFVLAHAGEYLTETIWENYRADFFIHNRHELCLGV